MIPRIKALGEAQLDRVLQEFLGGRGEFGIASPHVLPEEGEADDFTLFGFRIDDAFDAIPFLELGFFGEGGFGMKFIDLVFREDGKDIGPGHLNFES